jgi:iron-regulated transporter 1
VDRRGRLEVVRQSIVWQRLSVAVSCVVLLAMMKSGDDASGLRTYGLFSISVVLACVEKLAYIANTVAVERDWIIVVSDSLQVERQDLNSVMRRIDLVCKLIAPVGIGLLDGHSTTLAIWIVFAQNAISVAVEYWAIAQVYTAVPELAKGKDDASNASQERVTPTTNILAPWKAYVQNPAFLASFALSLLYLTVLSFASQMTTYLLTLGFTSTHVSLMRLGSVMFELLATCAAPWLMNRIGAVRAGLWFINEQLLSIALAIGLWLMYAERPMLAGAVLVAGIAFSRPGLWGFDLSVQYLVQDAAPESARGSFSAVEMALQNVFELLSFATTMVFYRPEDFKFPMYISAGAVATSAACFAGFVRKRRGHLLHTDKCLKRFGKGKVKYQVLPTIEEEVELDDVVDSRS